MSGVLLRKFTKKPWSESNGPLGMANLKRRCSKLKLLITNVTDSLKRQKLEDLYEYLNRNQAYFVNYQEREQQGHTYSSQVAESHIESIINARHKKSGKMQWTRPGARKVLQIRGRSLAMSGVTSGKNPSYPH